MVESVLNTKMKFFEENTSGRILNRFSKDIENLNKIVITYLDLADVR
jgi:ABC-type multidrug transport system fused ATPase/permease subunit